MNGDFEDLPPRLRALVCIAVLLDGHEGGSFLESDAKFGGSLSACASELASQPPELRMPLVGTLLRSALREVK